jgi:hypothetical protein
MDLLLVRVPADLPVYRLCTAHFLFFIRRIMKKVKLQESERASTLCPIHQHAYPLDCVTMQDCFSFYKNYGKCTVSVLSGCHENVEGL